MAMKGLGLDHGHRGRFLTHLLNARLDGLDGHRAAAADALLMPKRLYLYALQHLRLRNL